MLSKVVIGGWNNFTASLAEGIKRANPDCEILCIDPTNIDIERALISGELAKIPPQKTDIYADADFVILNTPDSLASIKEFKSMLDENTYVMDFRHVKTSDHEKISNLIDNYISCYVFLDSDPSGFTVRGDLFKDKIVAVISDTSGKVLQDIRDFWNIFGAKIVPTTADFFDEIMAETSHSIALASHMISHVLLQDSWSDTLFFGFYNKNLRSFLAPANKSVTGEDIIQNAENIRRTLVFLKRELEKIDQMIDNEEILKLNQYISESINFKNRL